MSRGAERIEGLPIQHVTIKDGPLAYVEVGTGPAVVLVPGYTGSKEDFGPLLAPLAAAGFRAIAYDQRGQFDSPGGPAYEYGPQPLAGDLVALLDALETGPAHLLGHSFGGLVARAAVLAAPAMARSLTLLDSGPGGIPSERAKVMQAFRAALLSGGTAAVTALLDAAAATPTATAFTRQRFLAHDPHGLLGMGDSLLVEPDLVDELAATCALHSIPVLVACGVDDNAWPPALQQKMAERLGARFALIAAAAHSPVIENPPDTTALLLEFFGGGA